jgi:hypothetical protein
VIIIRASSKLLLCTLTLEKLSERRLAHREQAERFYQELKQHNLAVRVGMEAS